MDVSTSARFCPFLLVRYLVLTCKYVCLLVRYLVKYLQVVFHVSCEILQNPNTSEMLFLNSAHVYR